MFYLNRLIAGAHNLLYRRRTIALRDVYRFMFAEVPREIRASAAPIFLAAALLFGPAAIAGIAVLRDPVVAATLLPPGMLDRAENGVGRAKNGDGYIPDPEIFRPVMATSIITNNVHFAIVSFAYGVTAGLLTGFVLVTNGIGLGAVFGLYGSKGIAALLLAFVAPHGVLELTAICISAGAGFLLAAALLVPGPRTRRRALIENSRRAIKLVAGATMMLLVAGTLEGFVSPIPWWPIEWETRRWRRSPPSRDVCLASCGSRVSLARAGRQSYNAPRDLISRYLLITLAVIACGDTSSTDTPARRMRSNASSRARISSSAAALS